MAQKAPRSPRSPAAQIEKRRETPAPRSSTQSAVPLSSRRALDAQSKNALSPRRQARAPPKRALRLTMSKITGQLLRALSRLYQRFFNQALEFSARRELSVRAKIDRWKIVHLGREKTSRKSWLVGPAVHSWRPSSSLVLEPAARLAARSGAIAPALAAERAALYNTLWESSTCLSSGGRGGAFSLLRGTLRRRARKRKDSGKAVTKKIVRDCVIPDRNVTGLGNRSSLQHLKH